MGSLRMYFLCCLSLNKSNIKASVAISSFVSSVTLLIKKETVV